MAKKRAGRGRRSGVNKAQAIRDEFGVQGADARPRDVRAVLLERGIKVSSAQVSNIKASLRGKGVKKGRRRAVAGSNGAVSVAALLEAKRLAKRMGGVEAAKRALDVLVRLQ
jgi:hypothetical protein